MSDKSYYVYKHTSPSNKVYIGITINPKHRWEMGGKRYIKNDHFARAIKKYGWDNFKHEILFEGLTLEEANEKEVELIRNYRSNERSFGYNLQNGGSNGLPNEETRRKMSEWQIGKVLSEETKQKISKSRMGYKDSDETRIKKSNGHKGKQLSQETKLKLSDARAKSVTDEQIERVRQMGFSNKGKTCSEETKRKLSESHKGINGKRVLCVETGVVYDSISEASRCTDIFGQNIGKVCNGKLKTTGGYHWTFV